MSYLTGPEICKQVALGTITIDPWTPGEIHPFLSDTEIGSLLDRWSDDPRVQPASYDLRLGNRVAVYRDVTELYHMKGRAISDHGRGLFVNPNGFLDAKKKLEVREFEMDPEQGWFCRPGIGYLMHTAERILTNHFLPTLNGKSSVGRIFTTCHVTAGQGDPGFNGQYTLEVTVTHPTIVYPGKPFCQVLFQTLEGRIKTYDGNYQGEASMGPVASRYWRNFEQEP